MYLMPRFVYDKEMLLLCRIAIAPLLLVTIEKGLPSTVTKNTQTL